MGFRDDFWRTGRGSRTFREGASSPVTAPARRAQSVKESNTPCVGWSRPTTSLVVVILSRRRPRVTLTGG